MGPSILLPEPKTNRESLNTAKSTPLHPSFLPYSNYQSDPN
jgi:hypothetical protein